MSEDVGVTSLSLTTKPVIADHVDGKWVLRQVAKRVEFVLDGVAVTELAAPTHIGRLDHLVSPLEHSYVDRAAVLSGEVPFDRDALDPSRLPLLVCTCGDLMCGALTVRLSHQNNSVTWSEWAWENQYDPPVMLDSMPSAVFAADDYEVVVREAVALAAETVEPETIMRVRAPGPWWRNIRWDPSERNDERAMLGWLMAEPVAPRTGEADGGYLELLVSLERAQHLMTSAADGRRRLDDLHRRDAVRALLVIEGSEHRVRLPPETLNAVRWYIERFKS